jgi:diguanylate cyclase (GGDEF)-like protein
VTLTADEFGLWLSACAPVTAPDGQVVAAVVVHEPAVTSIPVNGLRDEREFVFAAAVEDQALQLTRAELKASVDGLTGLFNHRYLQERLGQEVERAARGDSELALVFCDLDDFKAYNDCHGHSAGDEALRGVAQAVERCIRRVDVAARYGGEEIVVVLTDTGRDAALEVAERIRREVACAGTADRRVTVSIGVACYPADARSKAELLDRADWAMYRAKRLGRDQVVAYDADQEGPTPPALDDGYDRLHAVVGDLDSRRMQPDRSPEPLDALVARVAVAMGLDADACLLCVESARLHDVGQVGVPDEILQKRERLTPEEWQVIREHPRVGARLVAEAGGSGRVAETIAHHHEHWDGSGYPDGLVGQEIPLPARILAVCDAYCAMRSRRPQRGARTSDQAAAELSRRAGTQFDPDVVAAFEAVRSGSDASDMEGGRTQHGDP